MKDIDKDVSKETVKNQKDKKNNVSKETVEKAKDKKGDVSKETVKNQKDKKGDVSKETVEKAKEKKANVSKETVEKAKDKKGDISKETVEKTKDKKGDVSKETVEKPNNNIIVKKDIKKFIQKNKTIIIFALVLLFFVGVKYYNASAPSREVSKLISNIGEVTLNSEKSINNATEKLDNLSKEELKYLSNSKKTELENSKNKYSSLLIEDMIDNIDEVSVDNYSYISEIREAFTSESDEVQKLVSNISVLDNAEEELRELLVLEVETIIDEIGKVTVNKEELINNARTLYDSLSKDAAALVGNSDTLTNAEEELINVKATALKTALKSFKKEYDEVEGLTFYNPSVMPTYINTRSYLLPYLGIYDNGTSYMRIQAVYTADDWIFYKSLKIVVDDVTYTKSFGSFGTTRDNKYGDVWEIGDYEASSSDIEMLEAIANSTKTIVRFQGDDYHYDLTISASDKKAIQSIVTAYKLSK